MNQVGKDFPLASSVWTHALSKEVVNNCVGILFPLRTAVQQREWVMMFLWI